MRGNRKPRGANECKCDVCGAMFFASPSAHRVVCSRKQCVSAIMSRNGSRHGESRKRLHKIWCGMRSRCKNNQRYKRFSVDPEWDSYESFRDWALAHGYSDDLELDRRDNTKGYSPSNCRWATRKQQMRNVGIRSQKNKTSRFKGVQRVSHCINKWRALAWVDKKPKQIGLYETEEEAARAYDVWAKEAYGDYCNLNFKEDSPS